MMRSLARHSRALFSWVHSVYLHLENIHTTTNQVVFNMAAEKVICPEERFASLYVLLFYTVLAYLQQSLQKRQWSQVLHETTAADFLRLTTAFVVARLGKAIVMGLVLLTFTVQFNDIEPPLSYVFLTLSFFLLSQFPGTPGVDSALVGVVRGLDLYELEGLEEWWVPTATRGAAVTMSTALVALLVFQSHFILAALLGYTNVLVPWWLLQERCWEPLQTQRMATAHFPLPTLRQLRDRTCAVCLDDMRLLSARVTPCHHVLHAYCLRKCVQSFHQCPLCKHAL
uniref:RING-type domain-containing protein n=1 Tax=Cuerna arida TaxID=1464854 RepID=A0A1B6GZ28_9HEMI